jgi:hypothetical protein
VTAGFTPTGSGHLQLLTLFFSSSSCCRPHRLTRPVAVQPSIFPIHCLLLNLSVLACYPPTCLFTLSLEVPSSSSQSFSLPAVTGWSLSRFVLPPIPVIQPLCFQTLADSCCTMDARNSFAFNFFRTLSIAMGVYAPLAPFFSTAT